MNDEPPAVGKPERRRALIESIVSGQQPEQPSAARTQLERLLGPDELAKVDEWLLVLVSADQGELEPAFFDGLAAPQAEKRRRLRDSLLGRVTAEATTTSARVTSFDGGARETPPQPQTHELTLTALLRSGAANVGKDF